MEEPAPLVLPNKRQKVQAASRFDTIIDKHLGEKKPTIGEGKDEQDHD
jgi:hypothetical protein